MTYANPTSSFLKNFNVSVKEFMILGKSYKDEENAILSYHDSKPPSIPPPTKNCSLIIERK